MASPLALRQQTLGRFRFLLMLPLLRIEHAQHRYLHRVIHARSRWQTELNQRDQLMMVRPLLVGAVPHVPFFMRENAGELSYRERCGATVARPRVAEHR